MTTEQKIAAWKANRPAKSWKVLYKQDVFNVIARDEAQIHAAHQFQYELRSLDPEAQEEQAQKSGKKAQEEDVKKSPLEKPATCSPCAVGNSIGRSDSRVCQRPPWHGAEDTVEAGRLHTDRWGGLHTLSSLAMLSRLSISDLFS